MLYTGAGTALVAHRLQRKGGQAWRGIMGRVGAPLANSGGDWQGEEPSGLRQTLRFQTSSDAIT